MGFAEEARFTDEDKAREIALDYVNGSEEIDVEFLYAQARRSDQIPLLKALGEVANEEAAEKMRLQGYSEAAIDIFSAAVEMCRSVVAQYADAEVPDYPPIEI
jgi:hypothetical protein